MLLEFKQYLILSNSMCDANIGGYSHAPDDLAYGVDMKVIRWCGILQVQFIYQILFFISSILV
jgi:hypothetical protein